MKRRRNMQGARGFGGHASPEPEVIKPRSAQPRKRNENKGQRVLSLTVADHLMWHGCFR